jgi:hypothetical protein
MLVAAIGVKNRVTTRVMNARRWTWQLVVIQILGAARLNKLGKLARATGEI